MRAALPQQGAQADSKTLARFVPSASLRLSA
jgi:hypothetical protein